MKALARLDEVLGVLDPEAWRTKAGSEGLSDEDIDALVAEREQARADREWGRADEIRDQLQAAGVVLEDARDGTRWKRQ